LKFYARWADVVVLARELNLDQVGYIFRSISEQNITGPKGDLIKIEMFVHGALCMAISGKCYLSLHENNKSANRGECYQTCRKSYLATNMETGYEIEIDNEYIMSPKDLCTIGFLDKLVNSGVRVLKIEGRARSAEYVREVSSCYSEAIRSVEDGTFSGEKTAAWRTRLSKVFNRGFWDGYYLGQTIGEWNTNYGSSATKRKIYIGKITNYFTNLRVAEIKLELVVLGLFVKLDHHLGGERPAGLGTKAIQRPDAFVAQEEATPGAHPENERCDQRGFPGTYVNHNGAAHVSRC